MNKWKRLQAVILVMLGAIFSIERDLLSGALLTIGAIAYIWAGKCE